MDSQSPANEQASSAPSRPGRRSFAAFWRPRVALAAVLAAPLLTWATWNQPGGRSGVGLRGQSGSPTAAVDPAAPTDGSPDSAKDSASAGASTAANASATGLREPDPSVAIMTDEELASRLVGHWKSQFHGEMQINNRADRTASLVCDFDFLTSLVYGSRLEMSLQWEVSAGTLTHMIVDGHPKNNLDRLIRHFSDRCDYRILELEPDRLYLQEVGDPSAFHTWTRLPEP